VLRGCPELDKATWEWTTESASHALRLVVSGVFYRFPRMRIILGHMGETLPYMFWRLDSRCSDEPQIEDAAVVLFEEQFFRHHVWTILGRAARLRHLRARRR
jgi:predicted TIM-barrel fold metal-dependent hydrolase